MELATLKYIKTLGSLATIILGVMAVSTVYAKYVQTKVLSQQSKINEYILNEYGKGNIDLSK